MKSLKYFILRILNHNEAPLPIGVRDFWEKDEELVFEKLWKRIEQLPPSLDVAHKPVFNWWKLAATAASVALLMVVGWHWLIHDHSAQQPVETAYVIDSGSQVTLSDGTKVWLSPLSQ